MKILLTGFLNTSSEKMLSYFPQNNDLDVLLLENNKGISENQLRTYLEKTEYSYIFSFGQRPVLKNKVVIELVAKREQKVLKTNMNFENFVYKLSKERIVSKISKNAGTSYCNSIYFAGLSMILDRKLKSKMVFVHIPFEKNIGEVNLFFEKIVTVILSIIK